MGRESFDARLIAYLRRKHPLQTAGYTDERLAAVVGQQLPRAARYGLTDERSAATYVHTAWQLGADFDERIPSLAQILREPTMRASTKAAALVNFTSVVFHVLERDAPVARAAGASA